MTHLTSGDFAEQFGFSAGYVEKVYADWLDSPASVGEEWRRFFEARFGRAATPPADGNGAAPVETTQTTPALVPAPGLEPLRGVAAKIAANMAASLSIPTATSTREIPVKVLDENRRIVNEHLAKDFRGKTSFTHLVAWAVVKALARHPALAVAYTEQDGKPFRRVAAAINLGLAVDVEERGGRRGLVVPNVKDAGSLDFAEFLQRYDDLVAKARTGKLAPADFQDTTCTLTNPGTIGTISSLPRLMEGQGFIVATGAIAVPAAYQGASNETLTELGISKVMTVTNTYDHRVIQGAESGAFLATLHQLLTGEHEFFEQIFAALGVPHRPLRYGRDRRAAPGSPLREIENMERAAKVMQYIRAYRVRGYLLADLDPLHYEAKIVPELELSHYGLTIWDLDREFFTGGATGKPIATLREIRETLEATYSRHIGVEYMHIVDLEQKEWLRQRMEPTRNAAELPREVMLRVLDKLVEAEAFERFLHTRFVGHKRFSVEGGETLIPVLDALLCRAGELGIQRAIMGMAHRGRLNVLAHILGKPLTKIFSEFEGYLDPHSTQGSGDVKYHLGAEGVFQSPSGASIALELASNPSHLEAVDPVVQGIARARQVAADGTIDRVHTLPVLVHGDAAFAGQGVVAETLNMSQLRGYRTGGTIHVIVNNQIGYTTAPTDARSTPHCTDVAKAIQAPIFHVHGDDPLAAVRMVRLALEYRQKFEHDVVLDIVCYRRWGHNEGDEPAFTQPVLYREIETHPSPREVYQRWLLRAGVITVADVEQANAALQERLRASLGAVRAEAPREFTADLQANEPQAWDCAAVTAVPLARLQALSQRLAHLPLGFTPHPKIASLFERRVKMAAAEFGVDFAFAETLAFASLVTQGVPVRLAGQDSGRGTFSQRHAVLADVGTAQVHVPMAKLEDGQAQFYVHDSLLSEEAALGFEYGYSITRPEGLTLWEAQFGDFCNGAQIQIDQFLAAGESKWSQPCGLVLLLPHGCDGQGPEHSSARLERFLQLCAEGNLRVANPTTPAQLFHLLRRQALDEIKKPLVVMTTKSLLREKVASSPVAELANGSFQAVLDDHGDRAAVRRLCLCSGKIYYDLLAERDKLGRRDVALVRVELLYPWPSAAIAAVLARYPHSAPPVWVQEEPANMGAWTHVRGHLPQASYVGRPAAASPATGSLQRHKAEQAAIVTAALAAGAPAAAVVRSAGR